MFCCFETWCSMFGAILQHKQVHSLCVDSRPGDRLRLIFAKGPLFSSSIILSSSVWSSRQAFGDGREKNYKKAFEASKSIRPS